MRGPGQGQADESFPEGLARAKASIPTSHPIAPRPTGQLPSHLCPEVAGERHLEKYAWDKAKNSHLWRYQPAPAKVETEYKFSLNALGL